MERSDAAARPLPARTVPAPAAQVELQQAPRWIVPALLGVAAFSAAAAVLSAALAPREVVLEPVVLPQGLAELSPELAAERVHAAALALRERARASDELPRESDVNWMAMRVEAATDPFTAISRVFGSALGRAGPRIGAEVVAHADHLEIVLRERISHATLRSRVQNGPGALDKLLTAGGEDLLLLASPLAATALIVADPHALADTVRLDEALTMLARDVAANDDPRTLMIRASYDAANGRCREAIPTYDRVIGARPEAPRAYVLAADCHARLGERERALDRLVQAARQGGETPLALSLAGQAYRRIGYPQRGLELLRLSHARDPAIPESATAIGEALLALHRPAEALAWLDTHRPAEGLRARWLAAVGLAQVRSGTGPAAEATAVALRSLDAAGLEPTRIEAELAAATKAWPQALGRFGALHLIAPSDGAARAGEGQALLGLRRVDEAITAYRGCAEVAPWFAECRLGLGIALREADRAEEALVPFAEAAALDDLDPRIPFETAKTLRALLRRDEAGPHSARAELLTQRLAVRLALP